MSVIASEAKQSRGKRMMLAAMALDCGELGLIAARRRKSKRLIARRSMPLTTRRRNLARFEDRLNKLRLPFRTAEKFGWKRSSILARRGRFLTIRAIGGAGAYARPVHFAMRP
jgi:hypothetical protein